MVFFYEVLLRACLIEMLIKIAFSIADLYATTSLVDVLAIASGLKTFGQGSLSKDNACLTFCSTVFC